MPRCFLCPLAERFILIISENLLPGSSNIAVVLFYTASIDTPAHILCQPHSYMYLVCFALGYSILEVLCILII